MKAPRHRISRIARWALGAAAVVACGGVTANVVVARAARLQSSSEADGPRDVAIVPGGNAFRGRPAPIVVRRLEGALDLYAHGRVRRILVSGNETAGETTAMGDWLVAHGARPEDVLRDPDGRRTLDTMGNAARRFGVSSAIVATQDLYLGRSVFLARAAGLDAVGLAVPAGRLQPSAPLYEAAKRMLAAVEVAVLGRLDRAESAPVVLAQLVR